MIEAQIICCRECEIRDLGLRMVPGQERWVSDVVAGNSEDLRNEQRRGNVRVYRRTRPVTREPKRPPPPFVVRSRPPPREREEPQVVQKVIERVVEARIDTEEVARQVRGALLGDLREAVAEEVSRLLKAQRPSQETQTAAVAMDVGALEQALEAIMRRLMAGGAVPSSPARPERKVEPEKPLYVPGNLVDKDAKARISVRERAQEEGGSELDDAASALRKFKRRAGKTRGNEES
jgi:hypothetical protein